MEKFSVLMSVYMNDKPADVITAVESISIKQTVQPNEIYIYVDGDLPTDLVTVLRVLEKRIPAINIHWESENKGLGKALQYGMEHVKYELVARMDADDISVPNRFESQLKQFEENSELSVASGHISEFTEHPDNIVSFRYVPTTEETINRYLKKRDPLNHMAVMFRKSDILRAGNYQDWYYNEDSYLWLRMYLAGCKFGNLDKVLVNVRVGKKMYARRGGWKYFKSEAGLQKLRLQNKIISIPRYLFNMTVYFIVKCIMPNSMRGWVFQNMLRRQLNQ